MSDKELAQALFQAGLLTQDQIRAAAEQRTAERNFATVITQNGWLTAEQIASVTGSASDTPWGTLHPSAPTSPPTIPPAAPMPSAPPIYTAPPPAPPPLPPLYTAPAPIPEPSGYIPPPSYAPVPSVATGNAAQQSGMGTASVLPTELQGFNWGAFLMTWIWGIAHNTWIALVALVIGFIPAIGPIASVAFSIWLGNKGNELAWQNRKWESVEQFRAVQKIWLYWGLGFIVLALIGLALVAGLSLVGRQPVTSYNPATGTFNTR